MKLDDFSKITHSTFPLLRHYFSKFPIQISEYTVTNFLIWQEYYRFHYLEQDSNLFILSLKDPEKLIFFPPLGNTWKDQISELVELGKRNEKSVEFHRIPEQYLSSFTNDDVKYAINDDRDNWDYVYKQSDLANLPGKSYANVRKKLNRFKRQNQWEYKPITLDIVDILLRMQELWCRYRACSEDVTLDQENDGIVEILQNWDDLNVFGGAIFIKEIPVAYSIAEKLTSQTVVIHIEKASYEYDGAYQAIANEFASSLDPKFTYINREQDLGEPGLRKSKESYHPHHYIKKYIISA